MLIVLPFVLVIFSENKAMILNQEYVELYGRFRHPWHMIPCSWSLNEVIKYGIFCIALFLFQKKILKIIKGFIFFGIWIFMYGWYLFELRNDGYLSSSANT